MKLYLEIQEQLTEQELFTKQPQIIRIEVVSKDDALAKLPIYEPLFIGLNYIKRLHKCNHEDNGICEIELL